MLELLQTLSGHTDRVWTAVWNPSGTILATSGSDKTIRLWTENKAGIWDCTSILTQTHKKTIRRLCWSPCGQYLASASFDSTVCISKRQATDGSWITVVNLDGHESEVKGISWSHDGQYLASCGRDRTIWIWERAANASELDSGEDELDDADSWDCSDVKNDHSKDVKNVVWHPHHNILVSASYDDTVKFFKKDGEDWICYDTLLAHTSTVWSTAFSASGEYLVTCSDDKTVRVWKNHAHNALPEVQANSWKCSSVIQGFHSRPIYDVSWCQQSDIFASASGDNSIAVYKHNSVSSQNGDLFSCALKHNQAHKCDVNAVAWNPRRAELLASGSDDRSIKLWKYSECDSQGTAPMTVIDEIMKNLSETKFDCQLSSDSMKDSNQKDASTDQFMTFNVNNYSNLSYIIQCLITLQSEIYEDFDRQQLVKLLDLKLAAGSFQPILLYGLNFSETDGYTCEFYVKIVDKADQIRYKFKFIVSDPDGKFNLQLPRRSIKMVLVCQELFILEKSGDLFKILPDGKSHFVLGHLFALADVQFVLNDEKEKVLFIISADRDEKIRITNYPNTFEIERFCFGHKNLLSRIFIANKDTFVSVDQQGEGEKKKKAIKMEAIKKKMQAMKLEKDNAVDRAEQAEQQARDANLRAEKAEEEVRGLQKKIQLIENELDQVQEQLSAANVKLEEKEKTLQNAEAEAAASNRRIQLLEEDFERSEERLKVATQKLEEASQVADESERMRKMLEHRSITDEERMEALEQQLKEARMMAEDADRKYDEVARKLAMVEADLERAEERAETGESKIVELEEELKVVGNNLKSLEVSEEKALQKEETYEMSIRTANQRLQEAEARAEFAERSVQKLQKEVDRLEDELVHEKERYKAISDDLDSTFTELTGY